MNQSIFHLSPRAEMSPAIVNPVTGDRLEVLRSADAEGAATRLRFTLPAGSPGAPLHRHHILAETFTVNAGRLRMVTGDRRVWRDFGPGETVFVAPGVIHRFWNPHTEPATFETEVAPGRDFERFIRVHYGMARAGLVGAGGMPRHPLQIALLLGWADFEVPGIPSRLQRSLVGVLARLARLTGCERELLRHAV